MVLLLSVATGRHPVDTQRGVHEAADHLAGTGLLVGPEVGGVGPVVDLAQRRGGVEVGGEAGEHVGDQLVRGCTRTAPDGAAPLVEPGTGRGDVGLVVVPVLAVVVAEQDAAGSPSGPCPASRSCETSTRLPLDFDIFSPSRPTIPACT